MPILSNAKHEAFVQRMAKGENAGDAYKAIYRVKQMTVAAANGHRLLRNASISARLLEIQREVHSDTLLTVAEKREFYASVLRTPIGAIDENNPLCHSVKRTFSERGETVEYKALDKLKASELDSALAGDLIQKHEIVDKTPREPLDVIRSRIGNAAPAHARN